jgi:GNAT superfamily N-acetyltransferase
MSMQVVVYTPEELDERQVADLTATYQGLIEAVGWEPRWALGAALSRSLMIAVACIEGKAVGATRIVGDGIYNAILYDLVVSPEYQGHGVARALVDACLRRTRTKELACIAAPGASGFYRATGWKPVEGFILRKEPDCDP